MAQLNKKRQCTPRLHGQISLLHTIKWAGWDYNLEIENGISISHFTGGCHTHTHTQSERGLSTALWSYDGGDVRQKQTFQKNSFINKHLHSAKGVCSLMREVFARVCVCVWEVVCAVKCTRAIFSLILCMTTDLWLFTSRFLPLNSVFLCCFFSPSGRGGLPTWKSSLWLNWTLINGLLNTGTTTKYQITVGLDVLVVTLLQFTRQYTVKLVHKSYWSSIYEQIFQFLNSLFISWSEMIYRQSF